jgi:tetratricopeptide (TPR) repeat protein
MWRLSKILAAAAVAALPACGGSAFGSSRADWKGCEQGGNPRRAIRACSRIISGGAASRNELARAYERRGAAHAAGRRHDRAILDFTEALRLAPGQAGLLIQRGTAFAATGENRLAVTDFTEALRIDPLDPRAFAGRGQAYENRGEKEKARSDYRTAMAAPAIKAAEREARETARDRLAALDSVASAMNDSAKGPQGGSSTASRSAGAAVTREPPRLPVECPRRIEDLESQLREFFAWVDRVNLDEYARLRASASNPCKIDRASLLRLQKEIQTQRTGLSSDRAAFYQSCASKEMAKLIEEIKRREPVVDRENHTIALHRTSILHNRLERLSDIQVMAGNKAELIIRKSSRMKSLSDWAKAVARDCAF